MKVIFMGTPDFSTGVLESIIEAGHEVTAVVTQPDKPKGRGHEMQFTPVKEMALKHNLPVLQPKKIRDPEVVAQLAEIPADICVVVAFGQIIPKSILEMTKYGCINVHASLLPAYRGAAPIQWAVVDGLKETGVTIMQMDEGLDTGDMLTKVIVPLEKDETGGSLFDKLSVAGAKLCVETMELIEKGENVTFEDVLEDMKKRDHNDSTRALNPLRKADDAIEIDSTEMKFQEVVDKILGIVGA